jgi:hypothetical protein
MMTDNKELDSKTKRRNRIVIGILALLAVLFYILVYAVRW